MANHASLVFTSDETKLEVTEFLENGEVIISMYDADDYGYKEIRLDAREIHLLKKWIANM